MLSKFRERFKELRKQEGLSYMKMEEILGISRSTICRWEKGQTDIKSEELYKVAKFFSVSAGYLIGLED